MGIDQMPLVNSGNEAPKLPEKTYVDFIEKHRELRMKQAEGEMTKDEVDELARLNIKEEEYKVFDKGSRTLDGDEIEWLKQYRANWSNENFAPSEKDKEKYVGLSEIEEKNKKATLH